MKGAVSRTEHEAAEHGRRIIRERREREAEALRRANARAPHVADREPPTDSQRGRRGTA